MGAWSRVEGYPSDPDPNDPLGKSYSLLNTCQSVTASSLLQLWLQVTLFSMRKAD